MGLRDDIIDLLDDALERADGDGLVITDMHATDAHVRQLADRLIVLLRPDVLDVEDEIEWAN